MKIKNFIILSLMFVFVSVAFAAPNQNVYGIFTETFSGANIDAAESDENAVKVDLWEYNCFDLDTLYPKVSTDVIEGTKYWRIKCGEGEGNYGAIGVDVPSVRVLNMSNYAKGKIKMLVRSSTSSMKRFKIGVCYKERPDSKNAEIYYQRLEDISPNFSYNGTWQEISVNLSDLHLSEDTTAFLPDVKLSSISCVLYLSIGGQDEEADYAEVKGCSIDFDNIRWEKPENETAEQLVLSMAKVGKNEAVTNNTFSFDINIDTDLDDSTWKAANEYIKLELNKLPEQPCYLRFYTNNKSTTTPIVANPKYEGGGNPAGLINENDTSARIDACWRVSTYTITKENLKIYQIDYDLSDKKDEKTYCYIWMQDWDYLKKYDEEKPKELEKLEYSRIWSNGSVIYGPNEKGDIVCKRGTQLYGSTFLVGRFPLYVYLGANFAQAVVGSTYSTNTLTVELYYE